MLDLVVTLSSFSFSDFLVLVQNPDINYSQYNDIGI